MSFNFKFIYNPQLITRKKTGRRQTSLEGMEDNFRKPVVYNQKACCNPSCAICETEYYSISASCVIIMAKSPKGYDNKLRSFHSISASILGMKYQILF